MSSYENSPFNRSTITPRSPPSTPQPSQHDAADPIEFLATSEIKNWMTSIEQCLNEVVAILPRREN